MKFNISVIVSMIMISLAAKAGDKLTGTPIGTVKGYDYSYSRVVNNIQGRAFDGNLDTYFATYDRSYTWVGLDLGKPYIIDRVGWSPRNDSQGPKRVQLGVIQGANSEDWLDAVPLYIITEKGTIGVMSYDEVDCSKGFRYVRFVSTSDSRCNIAELEFYGNEGEGDDSRLFQVTNLPTVCINTVDAEEPYDKEHEIVSNIIIIDDHKANVDKPATVRERGNYSRNFPKKPWRIKFDKKQNVLDAPAKAKKWTLINNYGDKTLMRNMIAFEIARRLKMEYVPYARAVDVILNGEYKGCYQLCDQIEVKPDRVDIDEMDPTDISGDALTGGYLLEVDAYAYEEPQGEWFETKSKRIPVTIKSPDNGGAPEQFAYIKNYMEQLERRLYLSNTGANTANDYRLIFDVESFLRHFIVGELSGNTDTYWSTYMYKKRGDDLIYTGPVWDFDLAFDNDNRTYPLSNITSDFLFESGKASGANNMIQFASRVLHNDPRTADDLSRLWSSARNESGITADDLADYVDGLASELDESQTLNFLRWPILREYIHQNPVALGSYDREVRRVKNYIKNRIPTLDKLMKYDPDLNSVESVAAAGDGHLVPVVEGNTIALDGYTPFEVYATDGRLVYSGSGATGELLPGLYLVRAGRMTAKVAL
ncbi:MAG: hypothetical protein HDS68_09530 [Bacteroidales bacterium]|nr:hypothetical protein [Bacteroidales bacterium]